MKLIDFFVCINFYVSFAICTESAKSTPRPCNPIGPICPQIQCFACRTCEPNEVLVKSPCNNCCLDKCVPRKPQCPKIQCLRCPTCDCDEILIKNTTCNNCCLDYCVPKPECPKIECLACPKCEEDEILIESPCGNCCLNTCEPKAPGCEKCVTCTENETLIKSPCGNCCLDTCEPNTIDCPKVACKKCPTCAENETLIKSLCDNCCLDKCIPTPPICPKIGCEKCVECCKNETLVKSPCNNCCLDKCIPENCPNPPINCLLCLETCPEGEVMVTSPCGCCHNKCVPIDPVCDCPLIRCTPGGVTVPGPEPCKCPTCVIPQPGDNCLESDDGSLTCGSNLACCNGVCQGIKDNCEECQRPCPRPYCTPESIFLTGPPPCNCPYCVQPEPGGQCYESSEGSPTCGESITNLTCCNGVCQDISTPCDNCNCPLIKCSASAVIVPGPKPCRCPNCVLPKPGDKCLETFEGYLTCGADLVCCDGVCKKSNASCKEICHCPLVLCITGSVQVPGPKPCGCPTCILPEPGDKCVVTPDGSESCGENLDCCDGICKEKL